LINAQAKHKYFARAKAVLDGTFGESAVQFVTLSEFYDLVGEADCSAQVLLSKYTQAFQEAILTKYPSLEIRFYDFDETADVI
jgi:hypothetical protein